MHCTHTLDEMLQQDQSFWNTMKNCVVGTFFHFLLFHFTAILLVRPGYSLRKNSLKRKKTNWAFCNIFIFAGTFHQELF